LSRRDTSGYLPGYPPLSSPLEPEGHLWLPAWLPSPIYLVRSSYDNFEVNDNVRLVLGHEPVYSIEFDVYPSRATSPLPDKLATGSSKRPLRRIGPSRRERNALVRAAY
jgi:hypothetical protein